MNKQEAIEEIKNIGTLNIFDKVAGQQVDMVIKNEVLDIVSQIDEPQKVVVPKFVGEWIEYCKANYITLLGALDPISELGEALANSFDGNVGDCRTWVTRNQDTFAKAWLAYPNIEVEPEKMYTVEIPNPNLNAHVVLQKTEKGVVLVTVGNARWKGWESSKLTESEIKEDFEWAWQWAKEVE